MVVLASLSRSGGKKLYHQLDDRLGLIDVCLRRAQHSEAAVSVVTRERVLQSLSIYRVMILEMMEKSQESTPFSDEVYAASKRFDEVLLSVLNSMAI